MTEELFIRYYINEIPYSRAERLHDIISKLPSFKDWQWISANKFDYKKSHGYFPGLDEEIECIRKKCSAIIEHHNPTLVIGSSLIWNTGRGSPATIIDDLLTLFSIAQSKYINARVVESLLPGNQLDITHRPIAPLSSHNQVIFDVELETFIAESLVRLQDYNWIQESGFKPAIYWYRQAQQSFRASMFSLELSLYWIVLEILAEAYVQKNGLTRTIRYKKDRVKGFLASQRLQDGHWGFIDTIIDDCYEIRCASFHEGKLPKWPTERFEQRWRQFVEFVSFVLANLLQEQSEENRKQIALRISQY